MNPREHVCLALDVFDFKEAERLVEETSEFIGYFKVGLSLFDQVKLIIDMIHSYHGKAFLDLKFHDIPNTVANAVRTAIHLQAEIVNVHTTGGVEMMNFAKRTAEDEARKIGKEPPDLYGVTVLTSLDDVSLNSTLKVRMKLPNLVIHLAGLAKEAGLTGVICSGHEIKRLKQSFGNELKLIVPGIRPKWMVDKGDQKRVFTPTRAIQDGADIIVIGRPVIKAESPYNAARKLYNEVNESLCLLSKQ